MIAPKEYKSASRYVVKHGPPWATPVAKKYAELYLKHGTISATAKEAKKTPQSVGSALGGLVRKYKQNVKGSQPLAQDPPNTSHRAGMVKTVKIGPAKTKILSEAMEVLDWASRMSDSGGGDVVLAATPVGELVWRQKK